MVELMIYSLKVGACLAVFYLFFKLLLSRETFHRLNRILLLSAIALSFVLPLCVITVYRELPSMPELPVEQIGEMPQIAEQAKPVFPWGMLAVIVFVVGAVAVLLRTVWSLACVLRVVRRGRHEPLGDGTVLVRLEGQVIPFSWGKYIVVSDKDMEQSGSAILAHEKAHLHLHHSLDLLLTDIASCLQWFNPAMWLLRLELRAIHEYEADKAVLDSGADARQYQLLLIKKAVGGRWYSVANSFNHSKLKNRITMMLRKKSSRWACAKTLIALPLAGLALGAFAQTAYVFPDDKGTKKSVTVVTTVLPKEGSAEKIDVAFDSTDSIYVKVGERNGKPLILVDGKEVESIDTVDPGAIENMSVSKEGDVVAKYGEKAKNGVIIVTTKDPRAVEKKRILSTKTVIDSQKLAGEAQSYQFSIKSDEGDENPRVRMTVNGKEVDMGTIQNLEDLSGTVSTVTVNNGTIIGKTGVNYVAVDPAQAVEASYEAAASGIEAASAGIEVAMAGLEAARSHMSESEWQATKAKIEKAREQLAAAREQTENAQKKTRLAAGAAEKKLDATVQDGNQKIVISSSYSNLSSGKNAALYVINGKKASAKEMEKLKPTDIKSMSVLKNADAVKKYGKKAKNGVIIIETK